MAKTTFLLGGVLDPKTAKRSADLVSYDADDLTTHGVIAGAWQAKAEAVETMTIGLEKTDIQVEPPVLVWIPVK